MVEIKSYPVNCDKLKNNVLFCAIQEFYSKCSKEDMEQCWEETDWWKNQSSPEERIISGANVIKWINSPYCREILTWKKPNKIKTLEYFM